MVFSCQGWQSKIQLSLGSCVSWCSTPQQHKANSSLKDHYKNIKKQSYIPSYLLVILTNMRYHQFLHYAFVFPLSCCFSRKQMSHLCHDHLDKKMSNLQRKAQQESGLNGDSVHLVGNTTWFRMKIPNTSQAPSADLKSHHTNGHDFSYELRPIREAQRCPWHAQQNSAVARPRDVYPAKASRRFSAWLKAKTGLQTFTVVVDRKIQKSMFQESPKTVERLDLSQGLNSLYWGWDTSNL